METSRQYVLLTAARNEEAHIEKTLESVVRQTVTPQKWAVVINASQDRTEHIVESYAQRHDFICLVRAESEGTRNFGAKVLALREGYERMAEIPHDYVGILDADVSFEETYYEQMLARFEAQPKLGIAGGALLDRDGETFVKQSANHAWSVSGPVQMFRRESYQAIGGYLPLPRGGVDAVAEVMVRMHGWSVQTFPAISVWHHRRTGAEKGNACVTQFADGVKEYAYGVHPLFQLLKSIARMRAWPPILLGLLRFGGYVWAWVRREKRHVPPDVVAYLRREQKQRMWNALTRRQPAPSAGAFR